MSSPETRASLPPPAPPPGAPSYWWTACGGPEAIRAFHAASESDAWSVIERHPALLLPELVDAAEQQLGRSRALDGLREMHHALRGSAAYAPYHRLLVATLVRERRGSRKANLDRALQVIQDVRRAGATPEDEKTEAKIREALAALTPAPGPTPAMMEMLFLEDQDLAGLRRNHDKRTTNPNRQDRAFATNRGLAAGSIEWLGDVAAPVYSVSDARWVFASTKAAKAYVDSPATQLLSRDGLEGSAMLPIGDGAYAWGSAPASPGRQCVLFRVDRVVARLDITEGPRAAAEMQKLKRSQVLPFAEAVTLRVRRALAAYWLVVGRGREAAQQLLQAPDRKAQQVLVEYPILLLPEFPTAMASLGHAYVAAAERLAALQGIARSDWQSYRETLHGLVRSLLEETAGEPRVNADAALRLVSAHRRLDADPMWTALEAECGVRAEGA